MRKILNNHIYDTETAKFVGFKKSDDNTKEYLFVKKNGEFFLYGSGDGFSRYAKVDKAGNFSMGEKIIPMSYQTAEAWAKANLKEEAYEAAFGEKARSVYLMRKNFLFPSDVAELLERHAKRTGYTQTDVLIQALKAYIKE